MDNFRPPIIRRRLGALSENGSASDGSLFNASQKGFFLGLRQPIRIIRHRYLDQSRQVLQCRLEWLHVLFIVMVLILAIANQAFFQKWCIWKLPHLIQFKAFRSGWIILTLKYLFLWSKILIFFLVYNFSYIIATTHGACKASLRLPKEKQYETRVFRKSWTSWWPPLA